SPRTARPRLLPSRSLVSSTCESESTGRREDGKLLDVGDLLRRGLDFDPRRPRSPASPEAIDFPFGLPERKMRFSVFPSSRLPVRSLLEPPRFAWVSKVVDLRTSQPRHLPPTSSPSVSVWASGLRRERLLITLRL